MVGLFGRRFDHVIVALPVIVTLANVVGNANAIGVISLGSRRPPRVRDRLHGAPAGLVLHDADREQERGDDEQGAHLLGGQAERGGEGEEVGPREGGVHAALQLEGQVRTLIPHAQRERPRGRL